MQGACHLPRIFIKHIKCSCNLFICRPQCLDAYLYDLVYMCIVTRNAGAPAGGFADSSVRLWDATRTGAAREGGKRPWDDDNDDEDAAGRASNVTVLRGHSQAVYGVDVSLDRQYLLSASGDGTVRLWSTELSANLVAYK